MQPPSPVDVEHYLKASASLKASHTALLHEDVSVAIAHTKVALDSALKYWSELKRYQSSLKAAEGGREVTK